MQFTIVDGRTLADHDAALVAARRVASLDLWQEFVKAPRSFSIADGRFVRVTPATAPRTATAPDVRPRPAPQPRIATESPPTSKQAAHDAMQRRATELYPGLAPQDALWQHLNTDTGRGAYDAAARLPDGVADRPASPQAAPQVESLHAAEQAIDAAVTAYHAAHPALTREGAFVAVMGERPDLRQGYSDWHGDTPPEVVAQLRAMRGV